MLNHIIAMGRLTRDPELRYTQSGKPVASFTIACDRDGKDNKATDFIDCVAWEASAKFVADYFSKGRMAVVEGRLQLRDWTDRDGNKRRSAEIVARSIYFGDSKREGNAQSNSYANGSQAAGKPVDVNAYGFSGYEDVDDGELPF